MKKKKNVDISVIIVNFNSYSFLDDLLLSISGCKLGSLHIEKIVVDNGSSDRSKELISKNHKDVVLLANSKNIGFAKANNQGIKRSTGRYIFFLNPDTKLPKKTILSLVSFLEKNRNISVVSPKLILPNGQIDDACHRGFPTPWNALCHFSGLSDLFPNSSLLNGYHLGYRDLDKTHEIDACAGACMLVRRKIGDKIGWFDEDYFWYGEDLDFCYRVEKAGGRIVFYPHVEVVHYKGISSGIKKHSQHLSTADKKTRIRAQIARFEVMRIFYRKHYQDKYPRFISSLVMMGIKAKENIALHKL